MQATSSAASTTGWTAGLTGTWYWTGRAAPTGSKTGVLAPVIVDPDADEVYFTPIYYTLAHFSKYIRPGAVRIGFENTDNTLLVTAAQNPDGSIAVVVFNPTENEKQFMLSFGEKSTHLKISDKAIQTILINKRNTGNE
jgi:glucosylceramidase